MRSRSKDVGWLVALLGVSALGAGLFHMREAAVTRAQTLSAASAPGSSEGMQGLVDALIGVGGWGGPRSVPVLDAEKAQYERIKEETRSLTTLVQENEIASKQYQQVRKAWMRRAASTSDPQVKAFEKARQQFDAGSGTQTRQERMDQMGQITELIYRLKAAHHEGPWPSLLPPPLPEVPKAGPIPMPVATRIEVALTNHNRPPSYQHLDAPKTLAALQHVWDDDVVAFRQHATESQLDEFKGWEAKLTLIKADIPKIVAMRTDTETLQAQIALLQRLLAQGHR